MERIITYSKNVFIPLTTACANNCSYCGFRSENPTLMTREEVEGLLSAGGKAGCKEALFTFGERPEVYPLIKERLEEWGYGSVIDYLHDLCEAALDYGLLPHTNAGVMAREDLKKLKDVNASMGLMLESSSERLCEAGGPHEQSPGKRPERRIRMMEDAGRLKIPFTTGILLGIGETREEVTDSLETLRRLSEDYGHIQEVIIQNFVPKMGTPMAGYPGPSLDDMIFAVREARRLMPEMSIQIPPNLNPSSWKELIKAGANDLGGVSPLTVDHISPEAPWPHIGEMVGAIGDMGFVARERLCIYPGYIEKGWYPERMERLIFGYVDDDGLVREDS
jgi:7,8-didemethyl-8-hydroxy-5-deazariboflavin synthase CofG subunit